MTRLRSLDGLRGVAALIVVAYHFQHMAAFGQDPGSWRVDPSTLPFFAVLRPVYLNGWMAVDLFFVISGFVFYWIYEKAIRAGEIGFGAFFVLRVTRLYPLHLATLLLMAGLQAVYAAKMHQSFVIPFNDELHFVLHLFMAQSWGLEAGPSFNGPSWSISVEMLLYALFFTVVSTRWRAPFALVLAGLALQAFSPVLGRGVAGFFAGGVAFMWFERLERNPDRERIAKGAVAAVLALWAVTLILVYSDVVARALSLVGAERHVAVSEKLGGRLALYVVFPMTVFAAAASERVLGLGWRMTSWLGDISYASYLIHLPLQLAFACLAAYAVVPPQALTTPFALAAFFTLLLPASWAVYRWFELPAQRIGRRLLLGRRLRSA